MNWAEYIANLKATLADKRKRMSELMTKSATESRTMDQAESEEYDTIKNETKGLETQILRAQEQLEAEAATAQPVLETRSRATATSVPQNASVMQLKKQEKLEPGIAMARYAICLTHAKGNHEKAFRLAEKYYPQTEAIVRTLKAQAEGANLAELLQLKAAVAGGTTTDATWASPLVYAQNFMGDFISYLRPRTLIGQANFRPVPFNVRIGGQTSGGTGYWVGQGKAKPVTKFDFNATTVPFTKVAAISVITQELARFSDPAAEGLVRDGLADAVIERVDMDLFDPDVAAVNNVSPAGLLNGVNPVAGPANTDPDTIRAALSRLWAPWDNTYLGARPAYYTTPAVARLMAFTKEALGTPAFPGMTPTGGTLDGVPVRTSQYLANNGGSGGAPFILVDEAEVYLADDGSVTVDASEQASIEMSDAPSGTAAAGTGASLVSMWQTNSIALRAERFIWWGKRRTAAAQWIDGFPVA